jgi:large subunit ribosomal protein L33
VDPRSTEEAPWPRTDRAGSKAFVRRSADAGRSVATPKNRRTTTAELELRKRDPVARRHVVFREATA